MLEKNDDVVNYVNFLNKDNKSKKRKNDSITYDDALNNFKILAIERLYKSNKDSLKLNGTKLYTYLNDMKKMYAKIISNFKDNKQIIEKFDTLTRLYIIAELSVCIYYLKLFIKSNKYQDTLEKQLNECKIKLSNKKQKKNEELDIIYINIDEDEEEEEGGKYDEELDIDIINKIFSQNVSSIESKILDYYNNLSNIEKQQIVNNIDEINNYLFNEKPIALQIIDLPLALEQKKNVLDIYKRLENSMYPDHKLTSWFNSLMTIPFGKYKGINLDSLDNISNFLVSLKDIMDNAVYGHNDAKRQIIQIMGQQIKNPQAKGNIIGLWGPPGTGKTSLIKDGIAKAMDKPFIFISLGGATDASFLEGHSYTYEGSIYGRIVNGLISCQCMNPIIYFDELDKISQTPKGEEITNILVHLTDPVQNGHFRDKYFHGIDIDLSKVTFIFSFNDPRNVNPILLDRVTCIETKYLLLSQKINIVNNYLLPDMLTDINFSKDDIHITDDSIKYLINKYTLEGGIRKLKSLLYNIIREINIELLTNSNISKPYYINNKVIDKFLSNKYEYIPDIINKTPKVGVVYGLYAGCTGIGGILPIQAIWVPSQTALTLKTTGHLERVIKESTEVASSLAWTCISQDLKDKYLLEWKDKPLGFHIHCPDGAVPKDGPSAGAALTLVLYSLLTNKKIDNYVAMTGEINLEGNITAIGGLEEKLEGAKRAGVRKVLIPKENEKDLNKIMKRNKTLLDENFKVVIVEHIDDVLKESLL
jgi:endopeptidase La